MNLPSKIKKQEQSIARYENMLAYEKLKQRKLDIRRKIEFGGLVIKAGMDNWDKTTILGALIHAAESLIRESHYEEVFKSLGEAAFMKYGEILDKNDVSQSMKNKTSLSRSD